MESADVRTVFADRGVVRLRGAFSPEAAARIHAVAWRHAERTIGVRPDDRSSWPTNGWLPISWKRIKRQRVFDVMVDNALVPPALDAIFGAGRWQRPKRGPQVLFSMPGPEPWSLP